MPKRKSDKWPAGTYVLLANQYQESELNDSGDVVDYTDYEQGEEIELDERNALRLGEVGAIAKPDSVHAKIATGELTPVSVDLSQDEGALEAQLDAIKARLDELKSVESEREELRAEQPPHINVQSMKLQPRAEVEKAAADEGSPQEGQQAENAGPNQKASKSSSGKNK